MKKIFLVLIALTSVNPAFADLTPETSSPSTSTLLGGTLTVLGGGIGLGGSVDFGFKVMNQSPWYMGVSTGVHVLIAGSSSLYIPVALSNRYHFTLKDAQIAPYIGLDFGAGILTAGGAAFVFMFRPGFKFAKGTMFFEPKFGSVGSGFIFAPTVGVSF